MKLSQHEVDEINARLRAWKAEPTDPIKSDTCAACGAHIYLCPTGQHYKWVTNPNKASNTWHCGHDPDFPVKAHAPKEQTT